MNPLMRLFNEFTARPEPARHCLWCLADRLAIIRYFKVTMAHPGLFYFTDMKILWLADYCSIQTEKFISFFWLIIFKTRGHIIARYFEDPFARRKSQNAANFLRSTITLDSQTCITWQLLDEVLSPMTKFLIWKALLNRKIC